LELFLLTSIALAAEVPMFGKVDPNIASCGEKPHKEFQTLEKLAFLFPTLGKILYKNTRVLRVAYVMY